MSLDERSLNVQSDVEPKLMIMCMRVGFVCEIERRALCVCLSVWNWLAGEDGTVSRVEGKM